MVFQVTVLGSYHPHHCGVMVALEFADMDDPQGDI